MSFAFHRYAFKLIKMDILLRVKFYDGLGALYFYRCSSTLIFLGQNRCAKFRFVLYLINLPCFSNDRRWFIDFLTMLSGLQRPLNWLESRNGAVLHKSCHYSNSRNATVISMGLQINQEKHTQKLLFLQTNWISA